MPYDTFSTRTLAHRNQSRDDLAMARSAGGFRPALAYLVRLARARLLAHNFPGSRFRSAQGAERLHARPASLNIAGGALCDALVAAAVAEHGIILVTRDLRGAETYRAP
jgi:predicted nucleic acid-binding protein